MRKKIVLLSSKKHYKDDFEVFLRKTIPSALPIFVVETFKKNLDLSFKLGFPKNQKRYLLAQLLLLMNYLRSI